eukprot:UN22566
MASLVSFRECVAIMTSLIKLGVIINSLSYYEICCGDDCCRVWNSKGKSAVKYNVFKKKYRERQEPETLSFWSIAFISEHGYLDAGNDVPFNFG